MTVNKFILSFIMLFFCAASVAQVDIFTGTWQLEYKQTPKAAPVSIELRIASPERNMLYPARLKISCEQFAGEYDVLLVKRNSRQLMIGRNKIPLSETPFSLGNLTVLLNGTFDFSKDIKGNAILLSPKFPAKQYGLPIPADKDFDPTFSGTAMQIAAAFRDPELQFRKTAIEPWQDEHVEKILSSTAKTYYLGICDTAQAIMRDGVINFPGSKKSDNGTVSVLVNGASVVDQAALDYKKPTEEFRLDTGQNIIVFFADSYGRTPANTGKASIAFGNQKFLLSFADKKDVAATFIVLRIFYFEPKEERSPNENELSKLPAEYQTPGNNNVFYYPIRNSSAVGPQNFKTDSTQQNTLLRDVKLLGNMEANSRQITLAIWDDAVEDGDSISLSINNHWVVQGMAVKKRPQFIIVTLDPGQNKITFIADNLGSIIPNTSVLEIVDGKKRKSFMIDTNLRQNNLVNIFYNAGP